MSEKKEKEIKEKTRIFRFIVIGALNALIITVVISIMMFVFKCDYKLSNVVGYTFALINTFFWNKYWVFTSPDGKFWREVPLFLIAFGCAYSAQFLALLLMVEVLGVNEYVSQLLGPFVYGSVNYIMNGKVTFRQKKKK